ncbi:MAG: metallophosphoesterase, partial [Candidatus Zixiibacteriota bacterium]
MAQDKKRTWDNMNRLWSDLNTIVLDIQGNKYAIMSDIHLGDKGDADDFRDNEKALERALEHYKNNGYKLILLGDIEEFWQFDLDAIKNKYDKTIYTKIKTFGDENVFRVWGNHDSEWRVYDDPARNKQEKTRGAYEALKMKDANGEECILLLHGHQGSTESDKTSWFSRFWVRLFKNVEALAKWLKLYGHSSATKSQVAKNYERIFYSWAKKNKRIVICGHSHRAIFASRSYIEKLKEQIGELQKAVLHDKSLTKKDKEQKIEEIRKKTIELLDEKQKNREITATDNLKDIKPCYFNTGCALYTNGITAIEIA